MPRQRPELLTTLCEEPPDVILMRLIQDIAVATDGELQ
jgi:hypothetical protein